MWFSLVDDGALEVSIGLMLPVPHHGKVDGSSPSTVTPEASMLLGFFAFGIPDDNPQDAHRTRFACAALSATRPLIERFGFVPFSSRILRAKQEVDCRTFIGAVLQ